MYNVLYDTFKKLADDPQEPIDLEPLPGLLRNEIEMISQARYFSPQQVDIIVTHAVNDARLLVLPPPMSLEELERAWRVRGVVLIVLDDPEIQESVSNRLPATIKNQHKLYDSIVFLNKEGIFARKCHDEIVTRLQNDPTALNTLGLVEFESTDAYQYLTKKAKDATRQSHLPTDEKEELINYFLGKHTAELKQMPYYQRLGAFGKTIINVKRKIIDELRPKQNKFERNLVSYNQEVEHANGSKISMLEILNAENESFQTQQMEELPGEDDPYDNLVEEIKAVHGDDVAKTAKVYFEIYFQQEKGGKKVKQKQIAEALGKSRKTIGRHIRKIEKFLREGKKN